MEDDDVELSLLAQPVSQPPSDDGFGRSTSRPIAPSKDSSAEADKSDEAVEDERHDSSESGQVEKDSSSEHGPVEDESAEDSEVTLESVNEKQEESQQDPENLEQDKKPSPVGDEESPVAEAVQEGAGSEIAVGSDIVTELPQVQDEVAQPEEQVVALEASDVSQDSPLPATDFPVAFVAQEEPKIEIEVPQEQAEDVSSDDGSGSPSTDATAQFDENPEVVLDETATSVSVTENDEGSGSLAADAEHVAEQEKQSVAHADELEGSGLSVADALPEDGIVASDGLNEEGSGFLTADAPNGNEEGSGLLIPTEEIQSDALSAEGSGSADEAKVESPEQLNESEQVVVALTEADGSGDAGEPVADDESTVGPSVENDEASGSGPVSSVPEGDHPELSDDSPIKEEAKIEEVADDAVKFIPVEVTP